MNVVVKWQLKRVGKRLRALRDELHIIDEQRPYLADDAEDLEIRSVVSESGRDAYAARSAAGHVEAMGNARAAIVAEIAGLEARQDELLDRLSAR